jgi:hypothetical protein
VGPIQIMTARVTTVNQCAAEEASVSPASLSRVQRGQNPDLDARASLMEEVEDAHLEHGPSILAVKPGSSGSFSI